MVSPIDELTYPGSFSSLYPRIFISTSLLPSLNEPNKSTRHLKMCFFRRILARISAKRRNYQNIQSSSPTSSDKASSVNPQPPQPAACHLVFHTTKAAKRKSAQLGCPNDVNKQKNNILPLSSPKITQEDTNLALKIEKALALFNNDAWSPSHPQNNTLYNFIYEMAQRLVMIPAHLGLSLCESLVEDALVCLEDRSDADSDAFDTSMEVDLEQIFLILDELSTYTKHLS